MTEGIVWLITMLGAAIFGLGVSLALGDLSGASVVALVSLIGGFIIGLVGATMYYYR